MSASDALRVSSPRKAIGGTFYTVNKYNPLRDKSPVPAPVTNPDAEIRDRTGSVSQKRKNSDGNDDSGNNSYAQVTSGAGGNVVVPDTDDTFLLEAIKVKSLCEQTDRDIRDANADGTVLAILKSMNDAISGLCVAAINEKAKKNNKIVPPPSPSPYGNMVSLGVIAKRQRTLPAKGTGTLVGPDKSKNPAVPAPVSVPVPSKEKTPPVPPEVQSFRDTIKNAEKSTTVFNLNMGSAPILNTDTMSRRATLALTAMAAVEEGRTAENPSKDTVAMIDDILSVSTGMHFLGAATRSYRHPGNPRNGEFCTIPVRYEFKDKESRIRAEELLRTRCKASCSTPYPAILRECIKRVVADAKGEFPGCSVKAIVDTTNLCLKVAYRAGKREEGAKWVYATDSIPLPKEALDVRSRVIPESLTIGKPSFRVSKPASPVSTKPPQPIQAMETQETGAVHDG
jgi:hypothetical protein